jgi:hypothetical protein
MSDDHASFISRVLAGKTSPGEIDDFIDRWHDSETGQELHEYLGFNADEYELWLTVPELLPVILASRTSKKSLASLANDELVGRLGAQAEDALRIKRLQAWLSSRTVS